MARDDERQRKRRPADAAPPATTFAGTIMTLVAVAMLFEDDDDADAPASADRNR